MTKYATNNPLGSMDPKDLFDNAQNLDFALNDIAQAFWKDRFGRFRKSFWGMEQEAAAQLLMQQLRFNTFIQNSGYDVIGEYTDGPLTISEYNQLIRYDGELWKLNASTNIPFTTTGNDAASWANDSTHFVSVGDGALRQELLEKRVYAVDFGPLSDGTSTIQKAIDFVFAGGGGVVDLGPLQWTVTASTLPETFDNYGVAIPASDNAIILRKGVSLVGQKGKTKISCSNPNISVIAVIAPESNLMSGFEVAGGAATGMEGAGHGIVQYGTQGGADTSCNGVVFKDLYVHNVGSYGISMSNGNPTNCHIMRCRTYATGADGIDLKARGNSALPPYANTVSDTWVSNYNLRVDSSAGIDIRGMWHLSGISITDFGGNAAKTYTGIRFRTKPPATDPYNKAAAKSTLTGFTINPTPGAAALNLYGIECGSDDVNISNGTIEECTVNVFHTGNSVGPAVRGTVANVVSLNARQYGFRTLVGNVDIKYIGCTDTGAATAGFRVEGQNIIASGCVGTLSITGGAASSFTYPGSRLWDTYAVTERITDAIVALSARGVVNDIAIRLVPKGTGHIGAYGDIRPGSANTNYLGSASLPWAGGFTQAAFTITSDEKHKTKPILIAKGVLDKVPATSDADIMGSPQADTILDAWAEVDFVQFKYLDRIEEKGDQARWHFGVIAQRAIEAFSRHGIDAFAFGFACYDEWGDQEEVVLHHPEEPDLFDASGNLVQKGTDAYSEIVVPAKKAGSKYGIRYEEALVLEAALQRRNYERLLAQQENLVARIEALEGVSRG